jgi:hypothetical protein
MQLTRAWLETRGPKENGKPLAVVQCGAYRRDKIAVTVKHSRGAWPYASTEWKPLLRKYAESQGFAVQYAAATGHDA